MKNKFEKKIYILLLILLLVGIIFVLNEDKKENKNILFRTLFTWYKVDDTILPNSKEFENVVNESKDEIMKINHVIDTFSSNYWSTVIKSSFENDNLDGTMTLLHGTSKVVPKIVSGRNIKDNETGVAVCPIKFYPNTDPDKVKEEYVIDGEKILNTSFTIEYHDYDKRIDPTNQMKMELLVKNTYTKEFKVVGLYDSDKAQNDNGTCYISAEDLNEIIDKETSVEKPNSGFPGIQIIVDDEDNVDYVKDQLEKRGYKDIVLGVKEN